MDGHFYALLARMRYIQRWALMRNTEPENIQEHSHMVPSWRTPWRSSRTSTSAVTSNLAKLFCWRFTTMPRKF